MNSKQAYRNVSAIAAGLIWGFWAFYANRANFSSAVTSGLYQAITSVLLTLASVHLLSFLQSKFNHRASRILIPAFISLLITILFTTTIHIHAGTQNIIHTVLPNISAGFAFSLFTCFQLNRVSYLQS